MNKKYVLLSALAASVLTAGLTSEVPLLHKVATAQGETGQCAGVEMRKIDCPAHLWGTTTLSAVPATLLNLVAPVATAGERYMHQCSNTTPSVVKGYATLNWARVSREFRKFYPGIRGTADKDGEVWYARGLFKGRLVRCAFIAGDKPRAGRNVKPIK